MEVEKQGLTAELRNLFSRDAILFAIAICVVPNLLFLAASPYFLAERLISPLLYLAVGLLTLFVPGWLAILLFIAVAAIDLGLIIMFAFHLPINVAIDSMKYIGAIDVGASILYVSILTILTLTTLTSFWLVRSNRKRFRACSPIPATLLAAALSVYDWNYTLPYYIQKVSGFESARLQTQLTDENIISADKNLLIVMIEGLGAYKENKHREILQTTLTSNLPEGRYEVTSGNTYYKGSTTAAAVRELCGIWGDYMLYLHESEADPKRCLPNRLKEAGFETTAYHAFHTDMFERDIWYPRIGFQNIHFSEELWTKDRERFSGTCGSVFTGLCDVEIAGVVKEDLLEKTSQPKFIYWLTLNSHMPYIAEAGNPLGCNTVSAPISNKTVCELTEIWDRVFQEINAIAATPELPPTDILVVGDHHTPLWERDAKNHFILNKVDWFLLRDTRKIAAQTAELKD